MSWLGPALACGTKARPRTYRDRCYQCRRTARVSHGVDVDVDSQTSLYQAYHAKLILAAKKTNRSITHEIMSPGTVSALSEVKALTFDVFGTVVDWRSSVIEELVLRAHRKRNADLPSDIRERLNGLSEQDWGRFAAEWRSSYLHFTQSFASGQREWKSVDDHHRDSLVVLLDSWGLSDLYSDAEIDSLSLVWHRLQPWPDTVDGLDALRSSGKLVLASLSNANTQLVEDLDEFSSLGFDRLFCAETFHAYKPHPSTYLGAVRAMGLQPEQVAMVATHMSDLKAARELGLRTIYVERPREEAWDKNGDEYQGARRWVDLWIGQGEEGFIEMSRRLLELVQ